jgi:hypothetical protein
VAEQLGEAVLELTTDDSALNKGIADAKSGAEGLTASFTEAAGLIGAAFAAVGITASLHEVLQATMEAERESMLLAAAVKATGMAAGFTTEQLKAQQMELQRTTGVGDEAISSMQRTLMGFRNVHGEVFRQASQLALDFAAATGGDATEAARKFGMALNDPVNGLGRLKMAGVAVTDELKAQVEKLVESGDLVGAQTLLINELRKSYGGAAVAARDTLGGALNALKENFGNLFLEQQAAGDTLRNFVELVNSSLPTIAATFNAVFSSIKAAIEGVVTQLFYMGEGLFKLVSLDLKGAMDSFGQVPSVMAVANESIKAGADAWNATADGLARANEESAKLAASAPVTAGVVASAAGQMQASLMVTTEEYGAITRAEHERYKAVDDNVKKFNAIAVKQNAEAKQRDQQREANLRSSLANIATMSSSHNSTMAAMGKAAAITQALMDTYAGVGKAWALGPLLGPPMAAAVLISGMANVDRIRALADGGPMAHGETALVGERGPELFTAPRAGHIIPNHELGGGGGSIEVTNNINVAGMDFSSMDTADRILSGIADAAKRGTQSAIPAAIAFRELDGINGGRIA